MTLLSETHENIFFLKRFQKLSMANTAQVLLDSETWTRIANLTKYLGPWQIGVIYILFTFPPVRTTS